MPFCLYLGPSSAPKVPRLRYRFVLDEESEQPSDVEEEIDDWVQGKETGLYGVLVLCGAIRWFPI